ncbi:HDOD domain-containing protein [Motiliproteus sediminis]|uniref:HDOD domain-containing protein n=1 Tax=Motiliproteus sediminis TaxID=1468178 RepID=UPI001AEFFA60|nr:HDOD domain-containing protein [Motiliproteus sediminis]
MTPEEIIQDIDQLFSLPDVVLRVNELLESEHATITDIGDVIGHDPALSARLLKLVNSAFYGFPSQVDTISRAITLIGTNEVRSIVLASSATAVFRDVSSDLIDMNSFWHRSVYCGLVGKKIASATRRTRGESQFLTGLLHDLGKLILIIRAPAEYEQLMRVSCEQGTAMADLEEEWLGFSSAELGAQLLNHWRLPENLWQPVRHQYHPEACDEFVNETHTLNLAMRVTNCIEPELKAGSPRDKIEQLDSVAMDDFELSRDDLNMIAIDANMEALEVLSIINPAATSVY